MTATSASVFIESESATEIHQWLTQFAQAVREVDFEAARELFVVDVVSFGTVSEVLEGLDQLEQQQWRKVWGVTRGFDFDYTSVRCETRGESAWAIARWSSQGRNHKGWFDRNGRATFIFEKHDGRWIALHSHLSLAPASVV